LAFDGKALKGSFDAFNDAKARQILSAFAVDTALVLAHIVIDEKSNEIPAVQSRRSSEKKPRLARQGFERPPRGGMRGMQVAAGTKPRLAVVVPGQADHELCRSLPVVRNPPNGPRLASPVLFLAGRLPPYRLLASWPHAINFLSTVGNETFGDRIGLR
jgi:hypothetical protein